jgi:Ca2+-binding RTX toxin-like protein
VTVHGGSGTELIDSGSGNSSLFAGDGTDLLATNSLGTNLLVGGDGNDALIANRGGTNTIVAGDGNDLIVEKESASLLSSGFGAQTIVGGDGHDTLRFIINDQIPSAAEALMTEFQHVEAAFDASFAQHHGGTFQVDGLNVSGISGVQLQVDSVSTDPATPYLITHDIAATDGRGPQIGDKLANLLTTASNWGLLTV